MTEEKTVGEAFDRWLTAKARKKNASTMQNYRLSTSRFAVKHETRDITSIDEGDIDEHLNWILDQSWSKSTQILRYQGFKALWDWLYDEQRWIDRNPTDRVSIYDVDGYSADYTRKGDELKAKNGIVFVEPEEVEQLARHVRSPRVRNELMIKLAFQTGLRPIELCRIKCRDIEPDERKIRVKSAKRQNAHYRDVWYRESLDMLMERWMTDRQSRLLDDTPFLFTTNRSGNGGSTNVSPHAFREIVVDAADKAGIQEIIYTKEVEVERGEETQVQEHKHRRVTPHALRHGFAVACVRDGMDIRTLQTLMGHSKIETTADYLVFDDETLRDKVSRYGPK